MYRWHSAHRCRYARQSRQVGLLQQGGIFVRCPAASSAAHQFHDEIFIRKFRSEDTPAVSEIWLQALYLPGFTNLEHLRPFKTELELQQLVQQQLNKAFELKRQASSIRLRAERTQWLELLELELHSAPSRFAARQAAVQAAQLAKLQARQRRQRMNMCLVAQRRGTGQVVGYASVCMTQPEALLPPPFPCSKPFRFYLEGIAVAPAQQRQGAGSALLAACEHLGRRWGQSSLWLHVDQRNRRALELYRAQDYRVVSARGVRSKRYLMAKTLQRVPGDKRGNSSTAATGTLATRAATADCEPIGGRDSGNASVFVWDSEVLK